MKYMLLIYSAETGTPDTAAAPEGASMEEWMLYDKSVKDSGVWVAGEALADLVTATKVQVTQSGERSITDGPFAETREILGGFYVIDVPDLDVALDWAARCPGARDGSVVVRPVAQFD